MEGSAAKLPLRIIPRKRVQVGAIGSWLALFIGTVLGIADKLQRHRYDVTHYVSGSADPWLAWKLGVGGGAILLLALWQVLRAVAKLLPNSPCYHIRVTADALTIITLFRKRRFAWCTLGTFSVRKRWRRYGADYLVVASHAGQQGRGQRRGLAIQINPDEYGSKSGQEDAEELAAWFNRLRLASPMLESIEVPAAFRGSIRPDKADIKAAPSRTVTRN